MLAVGRVFDTKKHTNVKRKATYRRINKYYKSLEKTKAEKARREKILQLYLQGLAIKLIAQQVGVSERTVKRELSKIKVKLNKKREQALRGQSLEFERKLNKMNLQERYDTIIDIIECYSKNHKYLHDCKSLTVTINLDQIFNGRYGVKFNPELPINILENGKITLHLETGGKKQAIARIYVGKIGENSMNLQTNQSMNLTVKPVLKGLKIVEPKVGDDNSL